MEVGSHPKQGRCALYTFHHYFPDFFSEMGPISGEVSQKSTQMGPIPVVAIMLAEVLLIATLAADARFCGVPARDAGGGIVRSEQVLRDFRAVYPMPKDGRRWYIDHPIPLACGGCDKIINLQWLPEKAWRDKSTWERKVYGGRGISKGCP